MRTRGMINTSVHGTATANTTINTIVKILRLINAHNSLQIIYLLLYNNSAKIGKNRDILFFCAKSEYKNPKENTLYALT